MPDNIFANSARGHTPIAATNWQNGTQTRVYFLNQDGKSCQRRRTTAEVGGEGVWEDITDFPCFQPAVNSKLAATRTDNKNANIHVVYQDVDNSIKELVYEDKHKRWRKPTSLKIKDARIGTNLSIISGNSDYSNPDTNWTSGKIESYQMAPLAPLSAVVWGYDDNNTEIRLYSVVPGTNTIAEMTYSKGEGGWDDETNNTSEVIITDTLAAHSGVAALRDPSSGSIHIFYQPESKVIGLYSINKTQRIPLGIPATGMTKAERQRQLANFRGYGAPRPPQPRRIVSKSTRELRRS
ncbi:hypothetical protein MFIFM68171_02147 [Madurella fahalii]|uniref:Fucose-specific lectin n=1 Tax=Madurella fahalii TaxID=1157608 RepID=A0ABQ0G2F8_9PEZI